MLEYNKTNEAPRRGDEPASLSADELAHFGVSLDHDHWFHCLACGQSWTFEVRLLPRGFWQCPAKCNT